jgi:hypothetical protein
MLRKRLVGAGLTALFLGVYAAGMAHQKCKS